jgi:peptide/nickel transport system permease protein
MNENVILKKHVLPNALRPLISVAGVELGILLGGALITEVIFSLPGMGRLTVDSILARDYPLVVGCVFTAGAVMIAANFLADIIKLKIDKRLVKGILN